MNSSEFKDDLAIDPNQLDVEAGLQAELFFKYAEKAIQARERVDRLKLRLEATYATLKAKARLQPSSFGITKTTESSLDEAVKLHPRYMEVSKRLICARRDHALLDSMVSAMEQRKRMLEVLITLHGQQYFAGPSAPRNLSEAWMIAKNRRSNNVTARQRKRKVND